MSASSLSQVACVSTLGALGGERPPCSSSFPPGSVAATRFPPQKLASTVSSIPLGQTATHSAIVTPSTRCPNAPAPSRQASLKGERVRPISRPEAEPAMRDAKTYQLNPTRIAASSNVQAVVQKEVLCEQSCVLTPKSMKEKEEEKERRFAYLHPPLPFQLGQLLGRPLVVIMVMGAASSRQ